MLLVQKKDRPEAVEVYSEERLANSVFAEHEQLGNFVQIEMASVVIESAEIVQIVIVGVDVKSVVRGIAVDFILEAPNPNRSSSNENRATKSIGRFVPYSTDCLDHIVVLDFEELRV
jgi:hypothetical protein